MTPEQLQHVRTVLATARADLAAARVPDEAVAHLEPARRRWMLPRPARFISLGRVWRVGVLLLSVEDERVFRLGITTRAVQPGHHRNTAVAIEERRQVQLLAWKGPFHPGDVVNYGVTELDLHTPEQPGTALEPIAADDAGRLWVRWDAVGADLRPFDDYVAEQTRLRIDPTA